MFDHNFTFGGDFTFHDRSVSNSELTFGGEDFAFPDTFASNAELTFDGGDFAFCDRLTLNNDLTFGGEDFSLHGRFASNNDLASHDDFAFRSRPVPKNELTLGDDFEIVLDGTSVINDDIAALPPSGISILHPQKTTEPETTASKRKVTQVADHCQRTIARQTAESDGRGPNPQPRSKSSLQSQPKTTTTTMTTAQSRRANNRLAAAKIRAKNKGQIEHIDNTVRELDERNSALKKDARILRDELTHLQSLALEHQTCCFVISSYNSRRASRVVKGLIM